MAEVGLQDDRKRNHEIQDNGHPPDLEERKNWLHTTKPPLFLEPLSHEHTAEEKVAAMRAAISAGADVNEMDHTPYGYGCQNRGRPLHFCLYSPCDIARNLPAIKLLLQHGADPRLHGAVPIGSTPLKVAQHYQQHALRPEDQPLWDEVVGLFEEAIVKLGPKSRKEIWEMIEDINEINWVEFWKY